jgi:hypothetical protein
MASDESPAKKTPQRRVKWGKFYFDDEMTKEATRTAKWDGSPDLDALRNWVLQKAEEKEKAGAKGFSRDVVFPPGGLTTAHVAGRLKTLQKKDAMIRKQAAEAVERMFALPPAAAPQPAAAAAASGAPKGVVLRMDSDTDVDEDFPLDLPVPERAPELEAKEEKPKVAPPSLPPITDSMRDFWVASASELPSLPSLPPHLAAAAAAPKGRQRNQTRRARKGPAEHNDDDGEETEDEMPPLERPGPILQYIQDLHAIQQPSLKRQRVDVSHAVAAAAAARAAAAEHLTYLTEVHHELLQNKKPMDPQVLALQWAIQQASAAAEDNNTEQNAMTNGLVSFDRIALRKAVAAGVAGDPEPMRRLVLAAKQARKEQAETDGFLESLFGRFERNTSPEEAIQRTYKTMGWKIPPGGVQADPSGLADMLKDVSINKSNLKNALAAGLSGDKDALHKLMGAVKIDGKTRDAIDQATKHLNALKEQAVTDGLADLFKDVKIDKSALRNAVAAGLTGDKDALNKLKGAVSVEGKTKQAVDALKSAKLDKAALQSAVVAGMTGRPDKALKQLANAVDDKTKAAIKAQIGVRLNAVQS